MMNIEEKLVEISKDYEISVQWLKKYLKILEQIPVVVQGDEDLMLDCLTLLADSRISQREFYKYGEPYVCLKDSIDGALYRIYGDVSNSYLSDEHKDFCDMSGNCDYIIDDKVGLENLEYEDFLSKNSKSGRYSRR